MPALGHDNGIVSCWYIFKLLTLNRIQLQSVTLQLVYVFSTSARFILPHIYIHNIYIIYTIYAIYIIYIYNI